MRAQIGALLGGVSTKNAPQLQNLAMELRKVCCHPVRRMTRARHPYLAPFRTRAQATVQEAELCLLDDGRHKMAPCSFVHPP